MSLYHYKLKKEIKHFQASIKRLNRYIKLLKGDLVTNENVYIKRVHKNKLSEFTILRNSLIIRLEQVKRLIH